MDFKREIYFDNSATSRYKPPAVISAVMRELKASANAGRSGHKSAIRSALLVEEARDSVKEITGNGNVIFTKNCTEALNLAIFGLKLKGEVITSVFEHNSVLRPLKMLEDNGDIKIRYIKPQTNTITLKEVVKLVAKDTKAIVLSEMSNVTGAVHEAEKISEFTNRNGITLVLDTAQSLGHIKTDYKNVNILASSGHKGLHAPQGTGFLYFKDGVKLNPLILGGTGTFGADLVQPSEAPEGYESGTLNTLGIAGLKEGIIWTLKNQEKIHKKTANLSALLIDGLKKINGIKLYSDNFNGVVSFNIANMPSTEVASILAEKNISVRSGIHCAPLAHRHINTLKQGAVRASVGWCNNEGNVEILLREVKKIAH
ncbi:MAG: aminotransferase class V-fold PLP-dependent enzyme [Firmicutes bacterium]|nr:aminotransferase class V-fold PLP-dependent enzyme [Bacillota bacterium]